MARHVREVDSFRTVLKHKYVIGAVGVDDSSNYWLGSVAVSAPLLDLGSPGLEPRSGLSFLSLQEPPIRPPTYR
jgi:hypothetical protein